MKISTKGRYGLRAMVDLALHSSGDYVALNTIAERQNISENYMEQVFSTLRKAGIVKSVKGAQGGYALSGKPSNIKVGTILRALEGELFSADEIETGVSDPKSLQNCIKVHVWDKIHRGINDVVDTITLEDLVNEYKKANHGEMLMFYI
ncbi:MAG: RrF2 family transcriptional regulator [Clostridia bacterium]|nr:RrF2 family transcriptional regulator [Clostridia bacterium]